MKSLHCTFLTVICLIYLVYTPCAYAQNKEDTHKVPSATIENTPTQTSGTSQESPNSSPTSPTPDSNLFEAPPNQEDHFFYSFLNMLFSLATILVVILIISWIFKRLLNTRMQQLNTSSLIKIIERRSLTPKTILYVLEINGRDIAIAESINGVTLLSHFMEPLATNPPNFEEILKEKTSP